jgi:hypothetical protein
MKYLFVGGEADGKSYDVRYPGEPINIAIWPKLATLGDEVIRSETYVSTEWRAGETKYIIYALRGMSHEQIFEALMDGYRKPKERG